MSSPRTGYAVMSTLGSMRISRPKSTFCTLPPESRLTGVSVDGVAMSSSSMICSASARAFLRSTKGQCPFKNSVKRLRAFFFLACSGVSSSERGRGLMP